MDAASTRAISSACTDVHRAVDELAIPWPVLEDDPRWGGRGLCGGGGGLRIPSAVGEGLDVLSALGVEGQKASSLLLSALLELVSASEEEGSAPPSLSGSSRAGSAGAVSKICSATDDAAAHNCQLWHRWRLHVASKASKGSPKSPNATMACGRREANLF